MNKHDEQTYKDVTKWLIIIFIWILVLIFSIFYSNKYLPEKNGLSFTITGLWFLITGGVMRLYKNKYEKWYDKTFNNPKIDEFYNKLK